MIRIRVMMIISYLAFLFGYYVKKKHRCSYAYFAKSGNCLFSSSTKWVIDSGASYHMTSNSHIFNKFDTHTSSSHVTIADGSISQVLGYGTINLSPLISLSLVLSLRKFSFNLLSVSRITSNLQCSVRFYPEYYVFKDLKTKEIIGRGKKCDGLYVFELEALRSDNAKEYFSETFQSYMLQHGILHESSCVYRPAQNEVTKCKNRHLPENDDLVVYVSPTLVETTKQYAELDAPPLKVYARRPRITLDLMRKPSPQLKDAPIDAPNDVSNDVLISALSEAYGKRTYRYPVFAFISYDGLSTSSYAFVANLDSILVPKTVGEALAHFGWRTAMIEEMNVVDHNDIFYSVVYFFGYNLRLALHQLDMKNAFLHGDLKEEVYMEQPPGFVAQGEYGRVCKLKKALYELKQSSRAWFGKVINAAIEFGLRRSVYDHYVFYSSSNAGFILLVVYVDDIVITGSNKAGIKKLKSFIDTCFQTKDLRLLKYFLGIKVSRSSKGICLSQRKYFLDLLDDAGYLKGTPGLGILYANHGHHIAEGSTNADYAGCPNTSRSTTGYYVFVRGEIGFPQSKPMKMWCDNQSAIYIATNQVFHKRTKHIEVDCHFTREKLEDGTITTPHIRTKSQLADVLTKALPKTRINSICNKLDMINIYAQLEGEC
nr:cysteine-rich RLK (receptor-like protein kinase) 8 [Tanacetum cinerariifolium]